MQMHPIWLTALRPVAPDAINCAVCCSMCRIPYCNATYLAQALSGLRCATHRGLHTKLVLSRLSLLIFLFLKQVVPVLDAEYEALQAAGDALDSDEATLEQEAINAKRRLPGCQLVGLHAEARFSI